jgi:hypothetical protein
LFEVASLKFQNTSSSISDNSKRIYALQDEYIKTIDPVIAFARQNPTLAYKFAKKIICLRLLDLHN